MVKFRLCAATRTAQRLIVMSKTIPNVRRIASRIVLLEHVNLNITDEALAKSFYVETLGFAFNPKGSAALSTNGERRQLHVNAGLSQLHLCFCDVEGTPLETPQTLTGRIGLGVESIDAVASRLSEAHASFEVMDPPDGERCIVATAPNNNIFCISQISATREEVSALGGHSGGLGEQALSMPFVELECQPGTAQGIAAFYTEVFGAPTTTDGGTSSGFESCHVFVGDEVAPQEIRFVENPAAPSKRDYEERESKAYHIAVYVGIEDFQWVFDKAAEKGLVWVNPRFVADSALSWEEASRQQQFRIRDITDVNGELLLQLEHEVRSTAHPSCPLQLVQRP